MVQVKAEQLAEIRKHGESTYPYECCGLLLGQVVEGKKRVELLHAASNAREEENQHNRFLIPPEAVREAEKLARQEKLDIVGFYHSHPNAEAKPSQFDLDHAWPFYSYIIVSVKEKQARELTSWTMADDRSCFNPEEIVTL